MRAIDVWRGAGVWQRADSEIALIDDAVSAIVIGFVNSVASSADLSPLQAPIARKAGSYIANC